MQTTKWVWSAFAALTLAMAGCGSGSDNTSSASTTGASTAGKAAGNTSSDDDATPSKPVPVAAAGTKFKGALEVQAFKGGFGVDFYQKAAKEFDQQNPGLQTKVEGDPHVWEKLRPRLVAGTPPDLMFPGWGLDHWSAAQEGQLFTLDSALDSPPAEGTGTWRDTFEPALLKIGQKDGKQYVLPYYFNVYGWWYNPNLFAKNGWTVPKTFDELLALCDKIKAKGIAPVTFQGQYPYYMIQGMLLPWAASLGGIEAVNEAQNLVPGAWKSQAMLSAAKMIALLRDRGYFENGAVGLSHTESQADFINGKAAMIPCGTWLYSEEAKTINEAGPDFKMQYMLPPVVATGKGDPSAVLIDIEPWMIPSAGKNPEAAVGFYKYMTSLTKAKQFVTEKGSLMSIKGSDQVKLPDTLVEPVKTFHGSKTVWSYEMRYWYAHMEKELENALTSMLDGKETPEQFCARAEAAAEVVRKDDSQPKHKL